jgi:hypothetical protein
MKTCNHYIFPYGYISRVATDRLAGGVYMGRENIGLMG